MVESGEKGCPLVKGGSSAATSDIPQAGRATRPAVNSDSNQKTGTQRNAALDCARPATNSAKEQPLAGNKDPKLADAAVNMVAMAEEDTDQPVRSKRGVDADLAVWLSSRDDVRGESPGLQPGAWEGPNEDGVWRTQTRARTSSLASSRCGKFVVTGHGDGGAHVWTRRHAGVPPISCVTIPAGVEGASGNGILQACTACAVLTDREGRQPALVLVGREDGQVWLWTLRNSLSATVSVVESAGKGKGKIDAGWECGLVLLGHRGPVRGVSVVRGKAHDGSEQVWIATRADSEVRVWRVSAEQVGNATAFVEEGCFVARAAVAGVASEAAVEDGRMGIAGTERGCVLVCGSKAGDGKEAKRAQCSALLRTAEEAREVISGTGMQGARLEQALAKLTSLWSGGTGAGALAGAGDCAGWSCVGVLNSASRVTECRLDLGGRGVSVLCSCEDGQVLELVASTPPAQVPSNGSKGPSNGSKGPSNGSKVPGNESSAVSAAPTAAVEWSALSPARCDADQKV
eukprot:2535332-Rhodomonas_salina.2